MKAKDLLVKANKVGKELASGVNFWEACHWHTISPTRFRRYKTTGNMRGVRIKGRLCRVDYTAEGIMFFKLHEDL